MVFKIDFRDDTAVEWHRTETGVEMREVAEYTPTIYVSAETKASLADLSKSIHLRGNVVDTATEQWRPAFRRDPESVLRIDISSIDRVRPLAGWIRRQDRPGTYRLFNVDFSREFRYCLEQGVDPMPEHPLRCLELSSPTPGAPTAPVTRLEIGGESIQDDAEMALSTLQRRLSTTNPDILILSSSELIPALFDTADEVGYDLQVGRLPGYEQLAGASSFESYGQIGHSPARYNVPGRILIDRSNTFFYRETNLDGYLDLVSRSRKPLQELSWASIGNVLTAIQIRHALEQNVLVPWKSRRHEFPKTMGQLHEADRGGFTFAPDVGVHEDVHELDFSSLYPNIICTRNISPETIRCECHDRDDVPGLGYSICEDDGYLSEVLQPIIDARDELKAQIAATDDPEEQEILEGQSDALKWILVSCFGYQGFSNAKFGRIECHEAINAYAREILLDAKQHLEASGWRVVHGIVDSLWVTAREDTDQRALETVAAEVTEATDIRLEHEGAYDWIAFVPLRTSDTGALTKYFGRRRDGSYKYRGIECRQRSTPPFVADCQQRLIEVFDETRDPRTVCAELARWLETLEAGSVDSDCLAIQTRTSKGLDEYHQATRTTAALERRDEHGLDHFPGQDVQYIVVDDEKRTRDRVRLLHEDGDDYDVEFYRMQLFRAAESILSPSGWQQQDVEMEIEERSDLTLQQFSSRGIRD